MLIVKCNSTFKPEREYICQVLLREFLGLDFRILWDNRINWCLVVSEGDAELFLPDILFQAPENAWLTLESLPKQPLPVWDTSRTNLNCQLVDNKIPVIYGDLALSEQITCIGSQKNALTIPIDIFGSAFFMLSRYEELVKTERDVHDRFPAWASMAFQENFLDRPIVNEYLEILWSSMKRLWPGLERKKRTFTMKVSCDVDHVYQEGIKNPLQQIKTVGGDLVRRKSPVLATKSAINYIASRFGNYSFDPYLSAIDWIMDINERAGNIVAFYFKAGQTNPQFDSSYSLDEPVVRKLLKRIHERGHEIGLHPSYNTYKHEKELTIEADNLQRIFERLQIQQSFLGSRQHYLKWDVNTTPQILENIGIFYDTTLSFADYAGFRCGCCYEFYLFNLKSRDRTSFIERPLLVMECSLLDYMGMNLEEALNFSNKIKMFCRQYEGIFTILWHNTSVLDEARENYMYFIDGSSM